MRLFFLLVLAAASFGWWYTSSVWVIDAESIYRNSRSDEQNWIDLAASLAEQVLQLFISLASQR